ncbi:hypothetical protein IMZ11_19075 [Microtetraspora sp. AC03309]|uniref:hypothetical protein n=1 Tax=Microtetraspora sp. AC03309 TaxID=2779376 RepID=UPI001E4A7B77|nr:hypothetical protein [Microtetraspora sp. AC03309]MCC5577732.1 hypothetical protein [Microtetraspora sp. AC03309]
MDLSRVLLRFAAGRPRPLVVTAPHGTAVRLLVEAELALRGWRTADAPAGACLLVVCGTPENALARAVRTVWSGMAAPKALVELPADGAGERVAAELDAAVSRLADVRAQHEEAARGHEYGARGHGRKGPGEDEQGHGHDGGGGREDHDGSGHEHHDGGGHEHHMGLPGGVRMAERGPDRDGLTLDRLHVPLGPVLPYWPAGLVVETTLQGDVIQEAAVRVAGGAGGDRFWDEPWLAALAGRRVTRGEAARRTAGAHLDSLGRLLATAGWAGAAVEARRLRDQVLGERPREEITRRYDRFARRVGRSRPLRWMLRDLGRIDPRTPSPVGDPRGPGRSDGPHTHGEAPSGLTAGDMPGWARGDVLARTRGWLAGTGAALDAMDDTAALDDDEGPRGPVGDHPSEGVLALLPGLLAGAELAAARLIVASLDPDIDQVRPERVTAHG